MLGAVTGGRYAARDLVADLRLIAATHGPATQADAPLADTMRAHAHVLADDTLRAVRTAELYRGNAVPPERYLNAEDARTAIRAALRELVTHVPVIAEVRDAAFAQELVSAYLNEAEMQASISAPRETSQESGALRYVRRHMHDLRNRIFDELQLIVPCTSAEEHALLPQARTVFWKSVLQLPISHAVRGYAYLSLAKNDRSHMREYLTAARSLTLDRSVLARADILEAKSLGTQSDFPAYEALLRRAAARKPDATTKATIGALLGATRVPDAVGWLKYTAKLGSNDLRASALLRLSEIDPANAREYLSDARNIDAKRTVRAEVLLAASTVFPEQTAELLENARHLADSPELRAKTALYRGRHKFTILPQREFATISDFAEAMELMPAGRARNLALIAHTVRNYASPHSARELRRIFLSSNDADIQDRCSDLLCRMGDMSTLRQIPVDFTAGDSALPRSLYRLAAMHPEHRDALLARTARGEDPYFACRASVDLAERGQITDVPQLMKIAAEHTSELGRRAAVALRTRAGGAVAANLEGIAAAATTPAARAAVASQRGIFALQPRAHFEEAIALAPESPAGVYAHEGLAMLGETDAQAHFETAMKACRHSRRRQEIEFVMRTANRSLDEAFLRSVIALPGDPRRANAPVAQAYLYLAERKVPAARELAQRALYWAESPAAQNFAQKIIDGRDAKRPRTA